jgi:hypothetical protein
MILSLSDSLSVSLSLSLSLSLSECFLCLTCPQLEIRLLCALLKKFNSHHRVSVERVVSGIGLWNVCPPPSLRFLIIFLSHKDL